MLTPLSEQAEGLLRKHSKDLYRKKFGSHRWQKQQHKLALHHERTTNKRKDFIDRLVYKLFHHYKNNVLVAEDLSTSNMVKNKHLSKSICDASWGKFFDLSASMVPKETACTSTKLILETRRRYTPNATRKHQRNFLWL